MAGKTGKKVAPKKTARKTTKKAPKRVAKKPENSDRPVPEAAVQNIAPPKEEAPVVLPTIEGKKVVAIRDDGKHTRDAYHCDVQDGETLVTMHVPKKLFG